MKSTIHQQEENMRKSIPTPNMQKCLDYMGGGTLVWLPGGIWTKKGNDSPRHPDTHFISRTIQSMLKRGLLDVVHNDTGFRNEVRAANWSSSAQNPAPKINHPLTYTMLACMNYMGSSILVRWHGGFWSRRVEKSKVVYDHQGKPDYKVPEKYFTTGTIQALIDRDVVQVVDARRGFPEAIKAKSWWIAKFRINNASWNP